jgi:menaquinone reductase, molybdopterin-binding-like subunit
MALDRREFLWTVGTAAGGLTLVSMERLLLAQDAPIGPGWSPGVEEWVRSTCLSCPGHCGIMGRVVDGRLIRIVGNPLHPMSKGGLCKQGVAGVQTMYSPERIEAPAVRVGARGSGEWKTVTLDDAITKMAEKLRTLRGEGRPAALTAMTGRGRGTMHDVWERFFQAFGSPNHFSAAAGDGTEAVMEVMHGIKRRPSYDMEASDLVLSFGAPLFESWSSPVQAFVAFAAPGIAGSAPRRFIQVDHRFSRTAGHSDEWVGVRPHTHAVLALGIAYVILRDRLFDADFLEKYVSGFDDFVDPRDRRREGFRSLVLQRYRTEEVSAITGVPVARITDLARAFAAAERPVAVVGGDVSASPNGLSAGMAVHALNVLMGRVNARGGVLFGSDAPLTSLAPIVQDGVSRAGLEAESLLPEPEFGTSYDVMARLGEAAASPDAGIEALLLHGVDPLGSSSRREEWAAALERIPFVVSFSSFMDETTRRADLVIPDRLPWERWDDAPTPESYPYSTWGFARPLVEPSGQRTHTGEVLFALSAALGGTVQRSVPYESFEELLRERARGLFEAGRGRTFSTEFDIENHRQQEERGWWLSTQPDFESFWEELLDHGGWIEPLFDFTDPRGVSRTASGRIELMPDSAARALEADGDGDRLYGHGPPDWESGGRDFPLRLLPYRAMAPATIAMPPAPWLAEQPAVLPDLQWAPWVLVSPSTASALGLEENISVHVVSSRGRYTARLRLSPGVPPHSVSAVHGLRSRDGTPADPLALLDGSVNPLTHLPIWFTTFVRLERAAGEVA